MNFQIWTDFTSKNFSFSSFSFRFRKFSIRDLDRWGPKHIKFHEHIHVSKSESFKWKKMFAWQMAPPIQQPKYLPKASDCWFVRCNIKPELVLRLWSTCRTFLTVFYSLVSFFPTEFFKQLKYWNNWNNWTVRYCNVSRYNKSMVWEL